MKFLLMAAGLVVMWVAIRHFDFYPSPTLFGVLGGLVGASYVIARRLEEARGPRDSGSAARTPATIRTTAQNPLVIRSPSLGLLNLMGESGSAMVSSDLDKLGALFPKNVHVSVQLVPKCNVLFLYCMLEPSGRIAGKHLFLRDVAKAAGAQILVVASEINHPVVSSPDFQRYLSSSRNVWPANLVLTLNRNGETFGLFFQRLFTQMRAGISMPLAWVKLAPQGSNAQGDIPGTIVLLEGGHVTFGPTQPA